MRNGCLNDVFENLEIKYQKNIAQDRDRWKMIVEPDQDLQCCRSYDEEVRSKDYGGFEIFLDEYWE